MGEDRALMRVFVHREGRRLPASYSVHPRWDRTDRLQRTLSERECRAWASDLEDPTGRVSRPVGGDECKTIGIQVIYGKGDFIECT
jgi:hypothetical protein